MGKGMEPEEIHELIVEIMERQKTVEKEIKYLRDNLKAQNNLSKEMLRVHKINRDISDKNTKQLDEIAKEIKKIESKSGRK
ncbi:MAG: hypothetical protein KAW09_09860 [Thermoplasmata archaeon]|nr:hypothetical protein [Thermoplasmata archaeon]